MKLAKDTGEVTLDRACGDEKGLGDLAVSKTLTREFSDSALTGGQRVHPCEHDAARARAGGAELGLGLLGEPSGACAMGDVECLAEELPSFGASIAPPKEMPERRLPRPSSPHHPCTAS